MRRNREEDERATVARVEKENKAEVEKEKNDEKTETRPE